MEERLIRGERFRAVRALVKKSRKLGYSQMRLPGGTSFNGEINSSSVVYKTDKKNFIYFLFVPYNNKRQEKDNKEELFLEESPKELASRKLLEETGLYISSNDVPEPFLSKSVSDNRPERIGLEHTKHFFLLEEGQCEGSLIKSNSFIKKTSAPIWIPGVLVPEFIFFKHLYIIENALEKIEKEIKNKDEIFEKIKSYQRNRVGEQ